jgi:hypothetical protein
MKRTNTQRRNARARRKSNRSFAELNRRSSAFAKLVSRIADRFWRAHNRRLELRDLTSGLSVQTLAESAARRLLDPMRDGSDDLARRAAVCKPGAPSHQHPVYRAPMNGVYRAVPLPEPRASGGEP